MTTSTDTPFDPKEFRRALSLFPTGVSIITTRASDGSPVGLTCNSFSSVSLNPPLVSWSLRKESRSVEAFRSTGAFAINILSADQQSLSARFASSSIVNKFDGVPVVDGLHALPVLNDCAATFECKTFAVHDAGDHWLFIGEVARFQHQISQHPLVFCKGAYMLLKQALGVTDQQSPLRAIEIVEARRLIHGAIIKLACEKGSDSDFEAMEATLNAMERQTQSHEMQGRTSAGVDFFQLLGKSSHNSVIAALADALAEVMRQDIAKATQMRRAELEPARREILTGLKQRNAEAAEAALNKYLEMLAQTSRASEAELA